MARDPDAISREIESTRAELAETIDAISEKLSPQRAKAQVIAKAKAKVEDVRAMVMTQYRTQFQTETRTLRTDRVAMAGGAVVTTAALLYAVRRRRRRKKQKQLIPPGPARQRRR